MYGAVIVQEKNIRKGPGPLSVQIGMASSYWPHSFASDNAQQKEMPEEIQKMLLGIRKYQTAQYKREELPLDVVWQKGEATINAIPSHEYAKGAPAVVLIPSLINKATILDLTEERSMLRYLGGQNINAYLLDWGDIIADVGAHDMEGIIMDRLVPALEFLHEEEGRSVHALGYCMGGTLLMGGAVNAQDHLASIIMLAAPWDFHGGSQGLLNCVRFWAPTAFPAIEEKGVLGVDWIQTVFASLDPFMAAKKFSRFLDMDGNSKDAELFIAVEDWLNDGLDLPAEIAQHCISDWFLKNLPGNGSWNIGGRPIIPEEINCRALIIASDKDRLVEFETAGVLHEQLENAELLNPSCGHIGMVAGRHSIEKVWKPVAQWVLEE